MTNKNPTNETPILIEKFLAENSKINDADTVNQALEAGLSEAEIKALDNRHAHHGKPTGPAQS